MKVFWRVLNLAVIALLIGSATYVYKIKYETTFYAEKAAKLRAEIRREQEGIATLRAEWTRLAAPDRIQTLAQRHLTLKVMEINQLDRLDTLPARPPTLNPDPIGSLIDTIADVDNEPDMTGSIPAKPAASR